MYDGNLLSIYDAVPSTSFLFQYSHTPPAAIWHPCVRKAHTKLTKLSTPAIFNHMVEYSIPALDRTFHALANPTRREILAQLAQKRSTVLEIAEQFDMSLNGVSKHLKVLEEAGLIRREIHGRTHYCSLEAEPLRQAGEWISYYRQYWEKRLDALERFLARKNASE
jgi:DNA-binding transcriptional ArsR family regulator